MIISSYEQAKEYLESHINTDIFKRFEANTKTLDPLSRMRYFLDLLGNPQNQYASIQVTGTSGKGSTAYLLAKIVSSAGYKTGFTMSPHLQTPRERIQIGGMMITEDAFIELLNEVIPSIEKMKGIDPGQPSYFEILLAMAFVYFAKEKIDIVVAEVGLEGKYDGTNILNPLTIVLTNISLDHTAILGETVEAIAKEATQAIKRQGQAAVVVTGQLQPSVLKIVAKRCEQEGAEYIVSGRDFSTKIKDMNFSQTTFEYEDTTGFSLDDIELSLRGEYQVDNAALAIAATRTLIKHGFNVSSSHIKQALRTASFPGRFEVLSYKNKTIILDGAHNSAKMDAFLKALKTYYPNTDKVFIVGFKKDKDVTNMLKTLRTEKGVHIYTQFHTSSDYARSVSMSSEELQESVHKAGGSGELFFTEDVSSALTKAMENTAPLIVITGSLYLIGEMRSKIISQN